MTVITVNTTKDRLSLEQRRVLAKTLTDACGLAKPSPAWWVNFRVIEEGSWGSSGGVLSVLALLDSGVFTEEKIKAIRTALDV